MLDTLLFPSELQLTIQQIEKAEKTVTISVFSATKTARCPACGTESDRRHSVYQRNPQDLPLVGHRLRLCIGVRRFFCDNRSCGQRTFAERFPDFLAVKARRTRRLWAQQQAIAFAVGGEAGQRLCRELGMPISADGLIRAIRQGSDTHVPTPCVLGIDDWAKRKGQVYGTILIDLETHQPVDMLDSRTVEAVTAWLQEHPGVKIVSRDRGGEYVKGVQDGAPEAEPVADRWHLLSNLREALVTLLEKKPAALKAAAADAMPILSSENGSGGSNPDGVQSLSGTNSADEQTIEVPLPNGRHPTPGQRHRQARFEQVHALYEVTGSMRAVAHQLHMSRRAVKRYLNAERCPEYPKGRARRSILTPFLPSLQQRWQAGCTNASQLWREIQQEGFTGSRGLVARWATQERLRLPVDLRYRRQQEPDFPSIPFPVAPIVPWSAKRAAWLIVKKPPDLDDAEKAALHRMIQADPQVALGVDLAQQFIVMVRHRQEDRLDTWLAQVKTCGLSALTSFANGLHKDLTAVRNALRYVWSNGQTEGQVNRLKFIKRSMYGRANFDLLRKRVLARPTPTG